MKIQMILSGMSNHSIFSIINIQTIQNFPPMTVGKFSDYLKNSKNDRRQIFRIFRFFCNRQPSRFYHCALYTVYTNKWKS